ncbi:helix-turn-helix domain-containing protein [Streptomyces sp. M10(2022)]
MRSPDVAASAGFYDQSHFSRHFKRIVGTSPGHYARTRGGADASYPRSSAPRMKAA